MVKREDVQAVIDGILRGKILEVFESYYHDDVVMSENGGQESHACGTNNPGRTGTRKSVSDFLAPRKHWFLWAILDLNQ